ncbi:MAG: EAL domain-containing protein [Turicibacter sp.]
MPYIILTLLLALIIMFWYVYRKKFQHLLLLNKILEFSQDGYWIYYCDTDTSWWSYQNYQLLGLDPDNSKKDKNFFPALIHPRFLSKFHEAIDSLSQNERYQIVIKVKHAEDKYIWMQTSGTKYIVPFTKKEIVIGYNRDVSNLYEIAHEVKYLAFHDRSTDTLNSEGLKRKFDELKKTRIEHQNSYLIIVDLSLTRYQNGFTDQTGNEFVQYIVETFKKKFEDGKIARISEHEFTILAYRKEVEFIKRDLEEMNNNFNSGVEIKDKTYHGNLKVFCIELYPIETYEQYLVYRDYAQRHLVEDKKEFFTLINSEAKLKCFESLKIRNEFMAGINNNEAILYFQPIINAKTNYVSKLEALIRWNHPTKGILAPGYFLPYLYEASDIKQVDFWVFKEVFKIIHDYQLKGYNFPPVSINITGITLADETLVDYIKKNLAEWNVSANKICIEVTEQILIDNITVGNKNLETLKEMGVQIVLDDFGTGYSSIHYINQINAQVIKIDRSFIKDIHQNKKTQAIVNLIRNLAEELAVELIAEGIETSEELQYVLKNYCELVQGYLISKPLPIENILNDEPKSYFYN